jgi:serine-type D-Ala-D-Ala carboxypeptidase/endopeptidase
LLGYIMAKHQGMTYEELMISVIAKPLKLDDTRSVLTPKMKKNLAMGHHEGVQVKNWDLSALSGAGAIRSTAFDMIKYLAANMGKTKSELYPAMQLSHKNSRTAGSVPVVGLGWHTRVSGDTEIIWHNGGTGGYRAFAGFLKGGQMGVVVLTNSTASVDDIGLHLLDPDVPLLVVKPSIAPKMKNIIDTQDTASAAHMYGQLKKDHSDEYDFSEDQLNRLGNQFLSKGALEKAVFVFRLNSEAYPQSSSALYRLGEAYMKAADTLTAIENYKKSLALNPGNQQAVADLKTLGIDSKDLINEVQVSTAILDTYVGKYELAPGFILTVTRDGNQLMTQATGQPQVPVFPKSQNIFYLKVVEAQLTFNRNTGGIFESVTLNQGGRQIVGKRIDK